MIRKMVAFSRSLWDRMLVALHLRQDSPDFFQYEDQMSGQVVRLQLSADLTRDALHDQLLGLGVRQAARNQEYLRLWEELTPRQKQVCALICLGYSYAEIRQMLGIKHVTVIAHAKSILQKFKFSSRGELQARLESWDFGAGGAKKPPPQEEVIDF